MRTPRACRISNGVFAFAEFRTPEETDAALQLDGVPCAGSVLFGEGGPVIRPGPGLIGIVDPWE